MNHEGHKGHEEERTAEIERCVRETIDSGLKVHRALGPGLLESAYEHCLVHELQSRNIAVQRQVALPITYGAITLDAGYRIDILVTSAIVLELKAVDIVTPLHEAQLITYLKLSGHRIGLLMNFNVALFKQGLKRFVI